LYSRFTLFDKQLKKSEQNFVPVVIVVVADVVVIVFVARVTNPSSGNAEAVRQVKSVCQFVLGGLRRMRRKLNGEIEVRGHLNNTSHSKGFDKV